MANIKIAIINASTVLTDADAQKALPAFQTQIHRDFAPAWGIDADLVFVPKGKKPPAKHWWLMLLDNSDQAGALGYHDLTKDGLPLGKVFINSDLQYGLQWTVTATHELLEMLADPDINLTAFVQTTDYAGTLYAYEVCDACEDDQFGYKIGSVMVSDFVYPAWFESFRKRGSTQFDFGGHIQSPFELLKGGYISVFQVGSGGGWSQLSAQKMPISFAARPKVGSRRERRRLLRSQWMVSK